ncbi:MAG: ATP-binding protein [Syntrophothermus sp.]
MENANFKVDTRLTSVLGESYRSTEHAIKELVDNAWDADAENIKITLPEPLTKDPLVISDDGSGMTENEIRNEYLFVANSRYSRKGDRTPQKNRLVKGRKGIGKFAGLAVANEMKMVSKARSKATTLIIEKEKLLKSSVDLEKVDLPIIVEMCGKEEKGTTITLTELNENFTFPDPARLKQLLILEYSRKDDFKIMVNNEVLDIEDVPGDTHKEEHDLPSAGKIKAKFTVSNVKKSLREPGIAIRVNGKVIGKPTFFGLENDDEIPRTVLNKLYGEIKADGLADDVTADWGAVIENSHRYQELQEYIAPFLKDALRQSYSKEINLQKARLQKRINKELERLPEHKRSFAYKALEKILQKFYLESEDKIQTIISVVLDAFEKDEYWVVLQEINNCENSEVEDFANALSEFGIAEISVISQQVSNRLRFLDYLDKLIQKRGTLEKDIHKALEGSLWVLGHEYLLMSSNETMKSIIQNYTDKKYQGKNKSKRPDLLLSQNVFRKYLLVEFKRPAHTITRKDENQAEEYRDELCQYLHGEIEIIVMGGKIDPNISTLYSSENIKLLSFLEIIGNAKHQLNWLLNELKNKRMD